MIDVPISALEVAVVESGTCGVDTLRDTATFACRLELLGYHRIWYAEHHHSPAIGAFPPVVLIAHAAASTSAIRLGSGGVLAPNHAPITLAEQFGTLAALHPDRIDLGIGRGPGTFDEATARELRRGAGPATDAQYHDDVAAILSFLVDEVALGPLPEPWLLCSSTAGAALAARLGLPIAVAHHIRPDNTFTVLERYRAAFISSRWCEQPRVVVCVEAICAETEQEAAWRAGPMDVVKAGLLKGLSEIPFPTPADAAAHPFTAEERQALAGFRAQQACGSPEAVVRRLAQLAADTGADELMLTTPVYDLDARVRSYDLIKKHCEATKAL
ncbi:MsnO8 family LLM class oxidoreductase [Streptomyces sp. MMG1121]|uniref:MsnO8 family LLM class oxidoreductase n=1 Tax=Streptomyces sp. MMG1121 TaxID=1415544 RepID=UPI0006AE7A65|nr:MsnO8 family LLM class oxidoreductase [Streptomyces sp. MMG1121]KOV65252.1 monooxygenase [Streptomyces sp. MMG1121]